MMIGRAIRVDVEPHVSESGPSDPFDRTVQALKIVPLIRNSFVESALVHARALAYFLSESRKAAEVKAADYGPFAASAARLVDEDLAVFVRSKVISPVSNHVTHSKYAGAIGNEVGQHPGHWPIPELAVVLVGGVALVATRLNEEARSWFYPSPVDVAAMLEHRRSWRTTPSGHREVAKLTHALADRLDAPGGRR
jgi:hypothetical protein